MKLNEKQIETKTRIELFAGLLKVDPLWAQSVAMVESSLGLNQISPTGASGVFNMTTIAMKDLLLLMRKSDDDLSDITCGLNFLRELEKRWGTKEEAIKHWCNPKDRAFYLTRVQDYMDQLK